MKRFTFVVLMVAIAGFFFWASFQGYALSRVLENGNLTSQPGVAFAAVAFYGMRFVFPACCIATAAGVILGKNRARSF
jgi:hypothetical protein